MAKIEGLNVDADMTLITDANTCYCQMKAVEAEGVMCEAFDGDCKLDRKALFAPAGEHLS